MDILNCTAKYYIDDFTDLNYLVSRKKDEEVNVNRPNGDEGLFGYINIKANTILKPPIIRYSVTD